MKTVKQTLFEMFILLTAAVLIAMVGNTVRAKSSIKLSRNYFDRSRGPALEPPSRARVEVHPTGASTRPAGGAGSSGKDTGKTGQPDHGYQTASFQEVAEILRDPNTEMGVNLFIDARDDDHYVDGHIPGAIQIDHYRLDAYLDDALPYIAAADKVIVYCNGGDCEDSVFVCGDLLDSDVPYDKIYLFTGGWKEWTAHDMPVARGRDNEGGEE